jgi:uncharacterized protein
MDAQQELPLSENDNDAGAGRRRFLQSGVAAAAASMFPLELLAQVCDAPVDTIYGSVVLKQEEVHPDVPVRAWLLVPPDAKFWSFGRRGDEMADGVLTPGLHDGMGVCRESADGIITLVRNHEVKAGDNLAPPASAPAPAQAFTNAVLGSNFESRYMSNAPGGTTTLKFQRVAPVGWVEAKSSLSGTVNNCAGGVTPWGSWLTCEESNQANHGYVFEVRTDGEASSPAPITRMGRFSHEAAAVVDRRVNPLLDPVLNPELEPVELDSLGGLHGDVYLTEDNGATADCGFYRYIPGEPDAPETSLADRARMKPGDLQSGTLYIMRHKDLAGKRNTYATNPMATSWPVKWDKVTNLDQPFANPNKMAFRKLEGAYYDKCEHAVWIVASQSGITASGQYGRIFKYEITQRMLRVIYDSVNENHLSFPDNMTRMKDGSVLFCEDPGGNRNPRIRRIDFSTDPPTRTTLVEFPRSNNGVSGIDTEFVGACLSDDNQFLFCSVQRPSITFAVQLVPSQPPPP